MVELITKDEIPQNSVVGESKNGVEETPIDKPMSVMLELTDYHKTSEVQVNTREKQAVIDIFKALESFSEKEFLLFYDELVNKQRSIQEVLKNTQFKTYARSRIGHILSRDELNNDVVETLLKNQFQAMNIDKLKSKLKTNLYGQGIKVFQITEA